MGAWDGERGVMQERNSSSKGIRERSLEDSRMTAIPVILWDLELVPFAFCVNWLPLASAAFMKSLETLPSDDGAQFAMHQLFQLTWNQVCQTFHLFLSY